VVIAVLAAVDTVVLDTREATRELALLRVLGLGRAALGRAVIGQAAATALLGAALGVGAGVGLVYPEVAAASTPDLPLPFSVSLAAVLAVLVAVVAALALAAALPARQLARMDPTEALALE
jgi:putative ABC transport system permease protein